MKFLRILLTGLYVLLLIPAGVFGLAAYSDYSSLNCPGANQCTDALLVWQSAAAFGVGGLIIIGLLWLVRPSTNRRETESNA